ncbi:biotin-dependent carboxyltransferase family protein [Cellulophaga sp. F20128]|uniref:5-oxoprolinase subunit C family protein n=1 Tax=Cellulophaga sp. F20128 TaxID=2926413 RepID=UPI001FF67932|nr:biotin-dependent carboxyltransferase family protein [Cellulophaga sp. F20128]MCK0156693.1 biotin-dependent carboxyltransferase family protein [Cellulophaga sp. F20128]
MVKMLKAGFYTSIQDLGRFHHRSQGIPVSGAMDSYAVTHLNKLLENEENAAVLEITITGPTLEFTEDTYIAFGGAEFDVQLNGIPVKDHKIHKIGKGDVLSYGTLIKGYRGYLAIKGGFKTDEILGSRSWFKPVTTKGSFLKNDKIPYTPETLFSPLLSEVTLKSHLLDKELTVYKGPEFDQLSAEQQGRLFSKGFTIAKENNRMAYQLNELLEAHQLSMLTSATLPGTVQLTPAGKLIILMKDGQTTGGYTRALQLSEESIHILAQKKTGDTITFKLI